MIERLQELLQADEGYRDLVYLDHLGLPTIGCGHLIKKDDAEHGLPVGAHVSEDRIDELFQADVESCLADCRGLFADFDTMPESVQITAASLAFQLGVNRYRLFKKHRAAMAAGDWAEAAAQLRDSRLYKQTPERTERHARRLEDFSQDFSPIKYPI